MTSVLVDNGYSCAELVTVIHTLLLNQLPPPTTSNTMAPGYPLASYIPTGDSQLHTDRVFALQVYTFSILEGVSMLTDFHNHEIWPGDSRSRGTGGPR